MKPISLVITLIILTACSANIPAPVEERNVGVEIRQQAAKQKSLIEVYSLDDPAASELMNQAYDAEDMGEVDRAIDLVNQAIALSGQDPEYWQYLSELELQVNDNESAINHAQKSYDLGPKIGQLCYRNWLVISRALTALNRNSEAVGARQQADQCPVEAAPRF